MKLARIILVACAVLPAFGCIHNLHAASHRRPVAEPEHKPFFRSCDPITPAKADGFNHFICVDEHRRTWEILLRQK